MKFWRILFYITALYLAVDKGNIEIIKLLLSNDKLDINIMNVFNIYFIELKRRALKIIF